MSWVFWMQDLMAWRSFLTSERIFDVITHFWRHDKLFDVMKYFWCHDRSFDVMANFLTYFWHHELFDINDVYFEIMTYFWCHELFDVMMYFWCTTFLTYFWRHDELFDINDVYILTSWRIFDVMNFLTSCIFVTNFFTWTLLRQDVFFTSWRTFWHHSKHFSIFLTSCRIFDVMTNVLKSQQTFWRSWCIFDIMTNFSTSWWTFWRYDITFTSRRSFWWTVWRYDKLFKSWWIFNVTT